jgi:16S rRNA (uracil1498-N3)-methyltransferase
MQKIDFKQQEPDTGCMPAERFYADCDLQSRSTVPLEGPEFHHLAHVMRIEQGEEIDLVNGRNELARAKVALIEKKRALLEIKSCQTFKKPSSGVVLALPFLRLAKLEWVIEKGTELGADAFWLFPADGSEKESLSPHQMERLLHIGISAMKQCGRLDLPPIKELGSLEELFAQPGLYLYGDVRESAPLISERREEQTTCTFITGPEKGFSKKELDVLEQRAEGVRLHPNILRAETAPIAALVLLQNSASN